jgi:hypothetical protein
MNIALWSPRGAQAGERTLPAGGTSNSVHAVVVINRRYASYRRQTQEEHHGQAKAAWMVTTAGMLATEGTPATESIRAVSVYNSTIRVHSHGSFRPRKERRPDVFACYISAIWPDFSLFSRF